MNEEKVKGAERRMKRKIDVVAYGKNMKIVQPCEGCSIENPNWKCCLICNHARREVI